MNFNLTNLRDRLSSERGFTLIELLIVVLILGILAALAIPAFFGQSIKARDASAKSYVNTAQTAIELIGKEREDSYLGVTAADLIAEEPSLSNATLNEPVTTDESYTVQVVSTTGTTFSIARDASGATDYDCAPQSTGGCPLGGDWGD